MNTTSERHWYWRTPDGWHRVDVIPIGWPADFEWYAEAPGQRPPQFYKLVRDDGTIHDEIVVFPIEPWAPADALSDTLRGRGYLDLTERDEPGTCEHGLSADLCSGPHHYGEPGELGWD